MGDITGRPKAPQQQVVYVPQYISTPTTTTTTSSSSSTSQDTDTALTPEAQREKSLLSRTRSRLGTILTGFRGVLSQSDSASAKKTLLGE